GPRIRVIPMPELPAGNGLQAADPKSGSGEKVERLRQGPCRRFRGGSALRGYDRRCRCGMSAVSSGFASAALEPTKMALVFSRVAGTDQSMGKSGGEGCVTAMSPWPQNLG